MTTLQPEVENLFRGKHLLLFKSTLIGNRLIFLVLLINWILWFFTGLLCFSYDLYSLPFIIYWILLCREIFCSRDYVL